MPTGARGGEQRGVRGVWSGPVPLGAGANHLRGVVLPRSETEPEPGRPEQVPLCWEVAWDDFWECFASGLTPFSLADSSRDGQQPQLQLQGLFL